MPAPPDLARLTVRFWGVRGSTPTPQAGWLGVGGNTSCVEVRAADGTRVVLDAGTGARGLGYALAAEAAGGPGKTHVLLSHFHWDHLQGLPFFAPLYIPGQTVRFYAATGADRLRGLLRAQMSPPYFPVPFPELAAAIETVEVEPGVPFQVGSITVRPFPLFHPQGCHGYRVEAGGAAVVYATDYEHGSPSHDEGLREVARGADVLISDAQYTADEYALREGWGHTTWRHAAALAADAGVRRLFLFHHDPAHDDAALARICEQARERFPATDLATEGLVVRV
ncbi:MBL fold metallo-hydrolase [Rubrivirga sp. S365]|uniref:MBL fold metallo-hydrolase n=1 Tax=Rubrivirga litoralis TaxID=3075598 RepID=A0ABU3BQB2_9BACT|nr:MULTISPECIES: MBL fold metallo-hydrolase [unclassified Rubrivirga]MDT0631386.1 MBL fold metallo-hydrolase [Rubrivirga sp. F394]MDT7855977.1 MBL fold metallo-hydrolase [Rubrivirga sp. S365]